MECFVPVSSLGAEYNQGSEVNKKVISVNILIISALLAESGDSGTRATQHAQRTASYKQEEFLNVSINHSHLAIRYKIC